MICARNSRWDVFTLDGYQCALGRGCQEPGDRHGSGEGGVIRLELHELHDSLAWYELQKSTFYNIGLRRGLATRSFEGLGVGECHLVRATRSGIERVDSAGHACWGEPLGQRLGIHIGGEDACRRCLDESRSGVSSMDHAGGGVAAMGGESLYG